MTKLTDLQLIVLSRAAAHQDGFATRPDRMPKAAAAKVAASLVVRKLMREMKSKLSMTVWREGDEGRSISLLITAAGRKAIVAEEGSTASEAPALPEGKVSRKPASKSLEETLGASDAAALASPTLVPGITPRSGSKQALVIEMLSGEAGTTINALVDATGWLPHTTRAALTGLRKRGFAIDRSKGQGRASTYRITSGTGLSDKKTTGTNSADFSAAA